MGISSICFVHLLKSTEINLKLMDISCISKVSRASIQENVHLIIEYTYDLLNILNLVII